jgi:transcriptional regulator with XRE-family HTH domain
MINQSAPRPEPPPGPHLRKQWLTLNAHREDKGLQPHAYKWLAKQAEEVLPDAGERRVSESMVKAILNGSYTSRTERSYRVLLHEVIIAAFHEIGMEPYPVYTSEGRAEAVEQLAALPHVKPSWDALATVGKMLRDARVAKKITLRQFAAQIQLAPTSLSKIERGEARSTPETYTRIATALGLDVHQILAPLGMVDPKLIEQLRRSYLRNATEAAHALQGRG